MINNSIGYSKYKSYYMENRVNFIRGMSALEGIYPSVLQVTQALEGVSVSGYNSYESAVLRNIILSWGKLAVYKNVENL